MVEYREGSDIMHLPDLNIAKDRSSKENKYINLKEDYKEVFKGI